MTSPKSPASAMRARATNRRYRGVRRGAILVAVLVILIVVMMLAATLTRDMVRHHSSTTVYQRNVQSMLLAEAGVERALAQLEADASYRGERWELTPASLGDAWPGEVVIRVAENAEPRGSLSITVESHYPTDPALRVTHVRTVDTIINLAGESR